MHFVQDVICCKVTYFQSLFNALRINLINVYKKKKLKHLDYRDTKRLALPHGKSFFLVCIGSEGHYHLKPVSRHVNHRKCLIYYAEALKIYFYFHPGLLNLKLLSKCQRNFTNIFNVK